MPLGLAHSEIKSFRLIPGSQKQLCGPLGQKVALRSHWSEHKARRPLFFRKAPLPLCSVWSW